MKFLLILTHRRHLKEKIVLILALFSTIWIGHNKLVKTSIRSLIFLISTICFHDGNISSKCNSVRQPSLLWGQKRKRENLIFFCWQTKSSANKTLICHILQLGAFNNYVDKKRCGGSAETPLWVMQQCSRVSNMYFCVLEEGGVKIG